MSNNPAKPLFDALVAEAKRLFWAYDGPEMFPDTEEPGKLAAYDIYHATKDAIAALTEDGLLAVLFECPSDCDVQAAFEEHPLPVESLIRLFWGEQVEYPEELRQQVRRRLLDPKQDQLSSLDEAVSDTVYFGDEAIRVESDRRWTLTGRLEDLN